MSKTVLTVDHIQKIMQDPRAFDSLPELTNSQKGFGKLKAYLDKRGLNSKKGCSGCKQKSKVKALTGFLSDLSVFLEQQKLAGETFTGLKQYLGRIEGREITSIEIYVKDNAEPAQSEKLGKITRENMRDPVFRKQLRASSPDARLTAQSKAVIGNPRRKVTL